MVAHPGADRPGGTSLTADGLPAELSLDGDPVRLRRARADDVPALVDLLADDPLGAGREDPTDLAPYRRAFDRVDGDRAHLLLVAVAPDDAIVGTLQLTFLPGLARRGALRAQIEAVRVAAGNRGRGLGAAMVGWAVGAARREGAGLVQLTTDRSRTDARRFYERLGFVASHDGMKLQFPMSS